MCSCPRRAVNYRTVREVAVPLVEFAGFYPLGGSAAPIASTLETQHLDVRYLSSAAASPADDRVLVACANG